MLVTSAGRLGGIKHSRKGLSFLKNFERDCHGMEKARFFSSLEGMPRQNRGKDGADQLRQEMKKTQHNQNTSTTLNYLLESHDGSTTKPLPNIGSQLQNKTCALSEQRAD